MQVSRSIVVPATAQDAWEVLMDWERQADWMLDADSVTVVSDRREGVGVRLVVRTRLFGVPAFTEPMEVIGWAPPREVVIRHGSAVVGTGTWTLAPIDEGVRFTWTEDISLAVLVVGDLAARLYAPFLRMLMGRAMAGLRRHVIAIGPARRS